MCTAGLIVNKSNALAHRVNEEGSENNMEGSKWGKRIGNGEQEGVDLDGNFRIGNSHMWRVWVAVMPGLLGMLYDIKCI